MKKLLLFLLLFGIGIGVLWWIESGTSVAPEKTQIQNVTPFGGIDRNPSSVATAVVEDLPSNREQPAARSPQDIRRLTMEGEVKWHLYNKRTDLIQMRLASQSSESTLTGDRLMDVEIELFDSVDSLSAFQNNLLGVINAKTAEVESIITQDLELEYKKHVQIEGLEARMSASQELTDLEFDSPSGLVDLSDEFQTLFTMEDRINIRSKELSATGLGAQITILNTQAQAPTPTPGVLGREPDPDILQFIDIDREAQLDFTYTPKSDKQALPGQAAPEPRTPTLVQVNSNGSMSLNRIERLADKHRGFEAWGNARMKLSGGQISNLRADHLQGRMRAADANAQLLLDGISADGKVLWEYLSHRFRGEHMELSAAQDGELSRALITGFPRVLLNLKFEQSSFNYLREHAREDPLAQESKSVAHDQIMLGSESSIRMERQGDRVSVVVSGPATAESQGFLLRSVNDLVLSFPFGVEEGLKQPGLVTLEASGGVVLEILAWQGLPYSKLEAAALDLSLSYQDDKTPLDLAVNTQGGAKLTGFFKDGRSFTLDTPNSLGFQHRNKQLEIRQGFDVTLDVLALPGAVRGTQASRSFQANCAHLVRFNTTTDSFEARDGVQVTNDQGIFLGDRVEANGIEHIELWGRAGQQATLNSVFGRADADHIQLNGKLLSMQGQVAASLVRFPGQDLKIQSLRLQRLDVFCSELELELIEEQNRRITKAKAIGAVSSELVGIQRGLELHHADQLDLLRTEVFEDAQMLGEPLSSALHVVAAGSVHAHLGLLRSRFELWSDRTTMDWDRLAAGTHEQEILASGNVRFNGKWSRGKETQASPLAIPGVALSEIEAIAFDGHGSSLKIDTSGNAHLVGSSSKRVLLNSILPLDETRFKLTATDVLFAPESLDATLPVIDIYPGEYQIISGRLLASADKMDLVGRTTVHGKTLLGAPWTLSADSVAFHDPTQRSADDNPNGDRPGPSGLMTVIEARDNVRFQLDGKVEAFGDLLRRNALGISLSGDPCTIVSQRVGAPSTTVHSKWINFDPELQVITEMGEGRISAHKQGDGGPVFGAQEGEEWSLKFLSFKTEFDQDSILFFLEAPFFEKRSGSEKVALRASYSVIWVAREKWKDINSIGGAKPALSPAPNAITGKGSMDVFFQFIEAQGFADVVNEVYFEGPVQTFRNDKLLSRADAVYLDLKTGRGWLTGVTLNLHGSFLGRGSDEVSVQADWIRHSKDGSLTADEATITPCNYDHPHLKVVTGELKLTPFKDPNELGYQVSIKDNGIEMYDLFRIPLPPLEFNTDEELKPKFPSFRVGNTARFGQLLSVKFTQPAVRLGRFFHGLFSSKDSDPVEVGADGVPLPKAEKKTKPYRAKYDIDASYLSSRGGLVDLGFSIRERQDRYWLEWINGIVLDNGRDKGFLRIPEEDRGKIRLWLHAQGQLRFDKSSLGFSYSDLSDPAVQSEFFEDQFIHYEQDQTYLQWKRKENNTWFQASAQVRVDASRAGVEELPSLSAFRGRAKLFSLGDTDFIHSGRVDAAYLRRLTPGRFDLDRDGIREGTLISPFAPNGDYSDGLGAKDILRVDTTQVIEAPKNVGLGGLRFTPFTTLRGTYWDNAITNGHAARIVGEVGARLSTVLWKRTASDTLHQLSPFIEYRNDVLNKRDGRPLDIDATERALFGNFIQVGSRSRFDVEDDRSRFDFDFRGTYASSRSDGGRDGWLPIEVYSRVGLDPEKRRFDIWYDGRFNVEKGEAVYSHFSLGTRIRDDFGIQVGYQYGRDPNLIKLFDTASISGFYRWTDKWEFEARQSFSLLVDQQLGFDIVLRRYGHDLIFELESALREGEGSSLGFSVRPRLGYKPNRIGYTNW